ncbi:MAG: 3-dehydrosphinganine reductase [Cirrosporium novae-zelandiae]|nr:MAG: 3-dehydrosphinganine reductase [Cirrosporium novae-zelandiae]
MGLFSSKNHFVVAGKTVVITGGSQGMGRGVAKLLASKGANVVIVARNVKKLQEALEYIKASAALPESQRFHYISADLTDPTAAEKILKEVTDWNSDQAPDILWCCAGASRPDFFIQTPVETLRRQMDTNYWSAVYLCHAFLRSWLSLHPSGTTTSEHPRHIVLTSSVLSFVSLAGYSPYTPAKAALRGLSDALCQELELYNGARRGKHPAPVTDVKIHTVFPGGILSPGFEQENLSKPDITKKLEGDDKPQTPDEVATASLKGLEKGDYMVTVSLLGRAMKSCSLGGADRHWLIDTALSWVGNLIFLFVNPQMKGDVFKAGKEEGIPPLRKV